MHTFNFSFFSSPPLHLKGSGPWERQIERDVRTRDACLFACTRSLSYKLDVTIVTCHLLMWTCCDLPSSAFDCLFLTSLKWTRAPLASSHLNLICDWQVGWQACLFYYCVFEHLQPCSGVEGCATVTNKSYCSVFLKNVTHCKNSFMNIISFTLPIKSNKFMGRRKAIYCSQFSQCEWKKIECSAWFVFQGFTHYQIRWVRVYILIILRKKVLRLVIWMSQQSKLQLCLFFVIL